MAACLFAALVLAYLPANRGGFVWDDDDYVTNNSTLHNLDGFRRIWLEPGATPQYYPFVFTTFWVEHHLWGDHPLGYHVINVLLHAASTFLLWRILVGLNIPGALLAAMLFALHPVHVESVAWITERKNVLSGLFYLAAAWTYLRYAGLITPFNPIQQRPATSRRKYCLSLALCLAALLSKTITATLPIALLLLIYLKKRRITPGEVLRVTPMLLMGVLLGLFTIWMERHHVGTKHLDLNLSIVDRFQIAGRAICFYLGTLFWPADMAFIYPRWNLQEWTWTAWLYPTAVAACIAGLFLARRRLSAGPLVAALYFVITLAPALGFIDVYPMRFSFVADHFQYLASIGPLTLFAAALLPLPSRSKTRRGEERAGVRIRSPNGLTIAFTVPLLSLLGYLTWRQASNYQSAEILWRDTLAKNPTGWMPHYNLGVNLADQGRHDEAIKHFTRSIENNPAHADAYGNLGMSLIATDRRNEALATLQRAIELNPDYPEAHYNLAHLLAGNGDVASAMRHLNEVLRIRPDYYDAHNNLAILLGSQSRTDEAIEEFRAALRIKPDYTEARFNLAQTLLRAGRAAEALLEYEEVLRHTPTDADALAGRDEAQKRLGQN
jgi:tetratricopeptide (TPR) repeat protein